MHTGSCHCGTVKFTVKGDIDQAIECNCSHCSRKGFLLWFVEPDAFHITAGADRLSTYTFNTHAIQHQFCPVCGTQAFAQGRTPEGKESRAINIRCLEDVDLTAIPRVPVDGRSF